jgi:hypothetical protein
MGSRFGRLIGYFHRMRTKRHRAIYGVAGLITQTQARNLFAKATGFVGLVREQLGRE